MSEPEPNESEVHKSPNPPRCLGLNMLRSQMIG